MALVDRRSLEPELLDPDELKHAYFRLNEEFVTYCYDSYQSR